jgi:hypothetical protein
MDMVAVVARAVQDFFHPAAVGVAHVVVERLHLVGRPGEVEGVAREVVAVFRAADCAIALG